MNPTVARRFAKSFLDHRGEGRISETSTLLPVSRNLVSALQRWPNSGIYTSLALAAMP
jgi:hypothetical protein